MLSVVRHAFAIVCLVGSASAQPTPPPPASPVPFSGGSCEALPASFAKEVAAAEKARDASFAKALAAKKLTPWTGMVAIHEGGDEEAPRHQRPAASSGRQMIAIGSGEPGSSPTVELVSDRKGTVYLVGRQPSGDRKIYQQCGCAPITHGGARIRIVRYYAELPADVTYGGPVDIAYTDKVPIASWTNQQGGRPCPAPP